MVQVLLPAVFALHILAGAAALAAGFAALFARKGGRLHRRAGDAFVLAMLVMAVFAALLGVLRPGQIINVFISGFTIYLVATGWMAGRRRGAPGAPEAIALGVSLLLCVPFALVIFQIVTGVTVFGSAFAIRGPILIALCVFAGVMATAAAGDVHALVGRGLTGTPRVARHLWRMLFGLEMAFGSALTNGFARLLPGPYHVPPAFFFAQFGLVAVLLYWLVRVRLPGWGVSGGPGSRVRTGARSAAARAAG